MLFSSISFIYYFLPLTIIFYFLAPHSLKNMVLLIFSIIFYSFGEPKHLIFMLISIVQGYFSGIIIENFSLSSKSKIPKLTVIISILINLICLAYFKYTDFFINNFNNITGMSIPLLNITLPVGISFYTFQILSYTIDVYHKNVKAQRNFIDLATYISMFPQLIAGPIVRYSDIELQLKNRTHTITKIADGIKRFITGLSKKVLLANVLGELVNAFKNSNEKTVLFIWIYAISYMLQIYFDFSGYSDMAIGLGKIFGFEFTENFNYPYISSSITEFWRRWHISLGTWFRDYLYIPLGGNRVSKPKWFRNILIVWVATGFWHGADWNFIIWGFMFALLLINEKLWLLKKIPSLKFVRHIYVLFFVIISFIIFDNTKITDSFSLISSMFGIGEIPIVSTESIWYLKDYAVIIIVAIISATPLMYIPNNPILLIILLIASTAFLIDGSFNPFLYFRF